MKLLITAGLLACAATLAGCATPPPDPMMDSALASGGAVFEDKGEVITGSRIPQKSTTHVLKRVGNADYKKAKADGSTGNVPEGGTGQWGVMVKAR